MSSECNPEMEVDNISDLNDDVNNDYCNNPDTNDDVNIGSAQKHSEIQRISERVRDKAIKTEEEMAGKNPELGITYDAQFDLVNVLMLGTTASGKTKMSRDLIKKGFFKNLTRVYCVSTIKMSNEVLTEDNKNFPSHMRVRHYRINSAQDLSNVIDTIKGLCELDQSTDKDVRSIIIFDDVISVASRCNAYYTFLTYCRKYNTSTINIFQAVINQTNAWKVIVSNCPILVMFQLGFTSAVAARILNSVISMRGATTHSQSWLNRLFIDIVVTNSNYGHLFIDVTPSKAFNVASVRSDITNIFYQRCFAGNPLDEKEYRQFVSGRYKDSLMRVQSLQDIIPADQQIVKQNDNSDNNRSKTIKSTSKRGTYQAEEEKENVNSSTNQKKQEKKEKKEDDQLRPATAEISTGKRKSPNQSYLPTCRCQTDKPTSRFKDSKASDNESETSSDSSSSNGSKGDKETSFRSKQRRLSSRRTTPDIRGRRINARRNRGRKKKKNRKTVPMQTAISEATIDETSGSDGYSNPSSRGRFDYRDVNRAKKWNNTPNYLR